jgi:hypothetical protein
VRPLIGGRRREAVEIRTPTLLYALRIAEILLVKDFEEIGVAAVEGCRFKHA